MISLSNLILLEPNRNVHLDQRWSTFLLHEPLLSLSSVGVPHERPFKKKSVLPICHRHNQ